MTRTAARGLVRAAHDRFAAGCDGSARAGGGRHVTRGCSGVADERERRDRCKWERCAGVGGDGDVVRRVTGASRHVAPGDGRRAAAGVAPCASAARASAAVAQRTRRGKARGLKSGGAAGVASRRKRAGIRLFYAYLVRCAAGCHARRVIRAKRRRTSGEIAFTRSAAVPRRNGGIERRGAGRRICLHVRLQERSRNRVICTQIGARAGHRLGGRSCRTARSRGQHDLIVRTGRCSSRVARAVAFRRPTVGEVDRRMSGVACSARRSDRPRRRIEADQSPARRNLRNANLTTATHARVAVAKGQSGARTCVDGCVARIFSCGIGSCIHLSIHSRIGGIGLGIGEDSRIGRAAVRIRKRPVERGIRAICIARCIDGGIARSIR